MKVSKIKYGGSFGGKIPVSKPKPKTIDYGSDVQNVEKDSIVELTQLQKEFKESAKKETELKDSNTSTEFFSVLVFKTKEQRDAFYDLLGITSDDNQYIDGQKLIKALELQIATVELKDPGKFRCNAKIANLAMK